MRRRWWLGFFGVHLEECLDSSDNVLSVLGEYRVRDKSKLVGPEKWAFDVVSYSTLVLSIRVLHPFSLFLFSIRTLDSRTECYGCLSVMEIIRPLSGRAADKKVPHK